MKKLMLVLVAVMGLAFAANAQNNAIGFRLGTDAEVSMQLGMGDNNRLELDLGANGFLTWNDHHFFSLTGIYQWHWNIVEGLGWYVGPGAQVSYFRTAAANNYFNVSVGGQIGLDYDFPIPLQLSLDARPMWNFLGTYAGFGWGACFGIRYQF